MSAMLPYIPGEELDPQEEAKQRTQEWLRGVYRRELDREIGDEGLEYWTKDILERGQNRNNVLSNIRRSDEKWLTDIYQTELGRKLGDEGRKYWMKDLKGGQSREDVLGNIRLSKEYERYQGGADPEVPVIDDPIEIDDPEIECGPGQVKDSSGKGCIVDPEIPITIDCAVGSKLNKAGDGCVPIRKRKRKDKDPRYTPDPKRRYNRYWDSIDAAADTGNRMTDDYYQRFLPQMRKEVMLGIDEIGAADRYHGSRYEGTPPDYIDPEDLFKKYRDKDTGSDDDDDTNDSDTVSSLSKRLAELEKKYSISS